MLQKVFVVHEGETDLLPGTLISKNELYDIIQECRKDRDVPLLNRCPWNYEHHSGAIPSSRQQAQETTRV